MNKQHYCSLKKIALLGLITAILIVVSLLTAFIKIEYIVIQFTFGIFIAFCWLIPGKGMLIVGVIYGAIIDTINLSFVTIPITILINITAYFLIVFAPKNIWRHLFFVFACMLVFLYIPYQWFVTWNILDSSAKNGALVIEVIIDSIQFACSLIILEIIYFALLKTKLKQIIQAQL